MFRNHKNVRFVLHFRISFEIIFQIYWVTCLFCFYRSSEKGIVGYRLFGNELHIYGNERLTTEKRIEIENSIKKNFNGQVHFIPLSNVLKPQCTVRCGDYLRNDAFGRMGTVGMFGEIKNALKNDSTQTVALSSPHVISSGDIAGTSTGERIGECIWPASKANIHDVSIVKIDSSVINSLQRTYFNKKSKLKASPKTIFFTETFSNMGQQHKKQLALLNK